MVKPIFYLTANKLKALFKAFYDFFGCCSNE